MKKVSLLTRSGFTPALRVSDQKTKARLELIMRLCCIVSPPLELKLTIRQLWMAHLSALGCVAERCRYALVNVMSTVCSYHPLDCGSPKDDWSSSLLPKPGQFDEAIAGWIKNSEITFLCLTKLSNPFCDSCSGGKKRLLSFNLAHSNTLLRCFL